MRSNGSRSFDGEDARAVIRHFHDAVNQHNVDAIMTSMTDDCVFENTYPPPDGQRYEGQDAVRAFWERLFAASPEAHFEIEDIFASEDRGVIRWRYRWAATDDPGGHIRGVDIFRVKNGKVAEKLSYVKG
jgi:ketosteroid isomerase-like protein